MILDFYNEAGQLAISYKIYRCWVSEYQALPDLDANANAVAIQHIKLENEGWERDVAGDRTDRAQLHLDARVIAYRPSRAGDRALAGTARQDLRRGSETMRALAGELLLAAWEQGAPEHDLRRALTMLSIALPGSDREQLGALPVTERNLLLLRLHELSFGPTAQRVRRLPQVRRAARIRGARRRAGRAPGKPVPGEPDRHGAKKGGSISCALSPPTICSPRSMCRT